MTSGQMRKAFDRYYRAQTVLQSGKGGFGIGLCTAREFARAMGGDLTELEGEELRKHLTMGHRLLESLLGLEAGALGAPVDVH